MCCDSAAARLTVYRWVPVVRLARVGRSRVDSARSRQTGGTGLGLAIVKHVLMQHGAHLEITSKENEGSTFTAVFPKERLYHMI